MTKDYGEPLKYDPDFSGPVRRRSCTDVFWLLVFLVFLGGWLYVGYHGYKYGDVRRLLAPTDSDGLKCGLDVEDKPYLVFFDITKCVNPLVAVTGCLTQQVCVEKCPHSNILFESQFDVNRTVLDQLVCKYNVDKNSITTYDQMKEYIDNENCSSYILASEPVLGRCIGSDLSILACGTQTSPARNARVSTQPAQDKVCVRDPKRVVSTLLSRANALDTYLGLIVAGWVTYFTNRSPELNSLSTMIVEDLVSARWYLLGGVGGVIVLCFLYVLILRWVVAPVVWFSLIGLIALFSYASYKCYEVYKTLVNRNLEYTNVYAYLQSLFQKRETWLALLVICVVLTLILLLVVIFLRKRIVIAIALIQEGSKAVGANKTTVIYPLLPWLLQTAVVLFGVASLAYLLSVGESTFRVSGLSADENCTCTSYIEGGECEKEEFARQCRNSSGGACSQAICRFVNNELPTYIYYLIFVDVLGFFWMLAFVQGMAVLTLASVFSQWYWTFNKRDSPFFSLTGGIYRSIRYHMGTVAFGSLIIAIVRTINAILHYISHKAKKYDNALTRSILCLCKCCFYCLEKFLEFINRNAFIMCAVHGGSFCKSARDSFNLLMRNIIRVFVLDKVTDFIFLASKLLIAGGTGVAVYFISDWNYFYSELGAQRLHYNLVPAIVLGVVAYFIAMLFFTVYTTAVDTLFLCFLEDCERNDGTPEKPYFMSKNLMKILGKKNKFTKRE